MIRVLQVLGSLQRGGAETMIMNIYRKIDKNKVQFDFLVKERINNGYEDEVIKLGGRIFCVESAKKIGLIKYIKLLINVMNNNGPYDIVHSHVNTLSGLILLAAKLSKIRIRISHSHTTKQDSKILKKMISLFATNRIACGQEAGNALFGEKKFTIIPNGIDTMKFASTQKERKELKNKLEIKEENINICHIGRFVEVKNHRFIIEMAKHLKDSKIKFKIYMLGDGPLFESIKKSINENHLRDCIKLIGNVGNVNEYLKVCDLFILPSLYEGLPVTLIESQCAGIYSIVSDKVSKESDLGLSLIRFLPLDSIEWANFIKEKNYNCMYNQSIIEKKFIEKKYDINISAQILIDYYIEALNNTKGKRND